MRIALCLFALASPLLAQEKFEPRLEKGDKWTVRSEASLTLHMKVTAREGGADGEMRERHVRRRLTEVRQVEFTEVDGGTPEGWKVTFDESKERTGAPNATDAEMETRSTDVEGKSYNVTSGGDVTPEDTPDEIKAAVREGDGWRILLPREAKKLNDSWKITGAKAGKLVVRGTDEDPTDQSEVRVTLSEITNQDGSKIAVLALTGTLSVESKQGFLVSYEFTGALRYDLDAQRPVSLEISGEAKTFEGLIKDERNNEIGHIEAKGSSFRLEVFYSAK